MTTSGAVLLQRGLWLEYITLGWNVVGSAIVLAAGWQAQSLALAGFGIDSLIEIIASLVVVWQLQGADSGREQRALRLIGYAFFGLALYIAAQGTFTVLGATHAGASPLGIAWLAATLVVMLVLAWGKGRLGRRLGNPVLATEARVTLIDAYLAGAVLVGLSLNAVAGWWWADPAAGLVILYYAVKEGRAALTEAG